MRDLAYAHVALAKAGAGEVSSKRALKAYMAAQKIYQRRALDLEKEGAGREAALLRGEGKQVPSLNAVLQGTHQGGPKRAPASPDRRLHPGEQKEDYEHKENSPLSEAQKSEYFRRSYTAVDGLWFMR